MAEPLKPTLIRLQLEHTPSPNDPGNAPKFYQALGQLVIAWGRLEAHLLACILNILQTPATAGKRLPRSSAEHLKLWRDAFYESPALKPYERETADFADRMQELADFRNPIIHGHWEPFDHITPLSADVLNIKEAKETDTFDGEERHIIEIKRITVSTDRLIELAYEASKMNIELLRFSSLSAGSRRQMFIYFERDIDRTIVVTFFPIRKSCLPPPPNPRWSALQGFGDLRKRRPVRLPISSLNCFVIHIIAETTLHK